MDKFLPAIALVILNMFSAWPLTTRAQTTPAQPISEATQPESVRIAYKQEDSAGASLLARAAGGLVLMTVLAFAIVLFAKRYLPAVRGYAADGRERVRLIESRRITPKLTLFVIEFDGRPVLLAQSGDQIVELRAGEHARKERTDHA